MLSEESGEVFQAVSSAENKLEILRELVNGKHDFVLANKKIPEQHVRAMSLKEGALEVEFDGEVIFTDGEKLKAYFHIGNQHYFLETSYQSENPSAKKATLPIQGGLYVRQLRKLFRMVVPEGYAVQFSLKHEGQASVECPVLDISLNGMLVHFKSGLGLSVGDEIQGELKIGKHPAIQIAGSIRHFNGGAGPNKLGVEFSHLVHKSENRLQELLLMFRHDTFYLKKQKAAVK